MSKRTKVFMWPAWYPSPYDPLAGTFAKFHAEAISEFADIAVIHLHLEKNLKSRKEIYLDTQSPVKSCIVCLKPYPNHILGKCCTFLHSLFLLRKAYRMLLKQTGKPDLNHIQVMTLHTLFPLILQKLSGIPYIVTEHFSLYLPQKRKMLQESRTQLPLAKLLLRNAVALTAVTPTLLRAMQDLGLTHAKTMVTPNVVDTDLFYPTEQNRTSKKHRLLNVSSFDDRAKNLSGLLRAFKQICKQSPDQFELLLVGDGRDRLYLEAYANELGIAADVQFTGMLEGKELVEMYNSADLYVLFSHYETFGVVLIEALACNLPVMATRTGGVPDIIDASNGVLIEPGDESALQEAILNYFKAPVAFDKKEIRESVLEKYSYPAVGRQFSALYREVLSKNESQ